MISAEKPAVDIFIPVIPGNCRKFPAALCSALTQTYSNIRVVLFLDCIHPMLEDILEKFWYTRNEEPGADQTSVKYHRLSKELTVEECERGVVIRNPNGPSGTAGIPRQWLFEWEGKSPFVKMLDSDDILTPEAIAIMLRYYRPGVDGVFCPIVRVSSFRFAQIMDGKPKLGHAGSGSMMLRKEFMDQMVSEGFEWPNKPGHDKAFFEFCEDRDFRFETTEEFNVLYLYLK